MASGTSAHAAALPRRAAATGSILELDLLVTQCRACPRLVAWRERVAAEKRAAFAEETYWGRPVPGLGPSSARILIVGLAPAAHGANRTGRMFTGDRSGDFLFAALYRAGLASQPESVSMDDGLHLDDVRITAPVHCAPPDNKPTPQERDTCRPFLQRELELLRPQVVITLGGFGWQTLLTSLQAIGWQLPRPRPVFRHAAEVTIEHPDGRSLTVLGSYHVSQQNTFTGRLTPPMIDEVLTRAKVLAALG